jgi:flagellar motor protein MotB
MTKMRIVVMCVFYLVVLGGAVVAYQYWFVPHQEEVAEEEAEQQHQEEIDKTSSQSRYRHEITFHADAFSGYAGFRSEEFKNECAKYAIKVNMVDDGANYAARLKAIDDGKCDMGVFTVDALWKASCDLGDLPATIVAIIDETKGADAMVGAGDLFPNLDSLNDPDLKIVCILDSPAETLARVVMAYFSLDQLGPHSFEFKNSAQEVYEAYKQSKPTDKKVFVLWEPYVSQVIENTDYHVIVDSSKFKGYIVDVIVARRGYLLKNETVVENVVKAYLTSIFKNRNNMVELVIEDAKQLGEPLKQEQAENLVKGIWWKNTTENFGHFGFTTGHGLQHIEEICINIRDVLMKTDAIKSDVTSGQPNRLFYDGIVRKLFDTSWHPGFGREDVRQEKTLIALSDEEWENLQPAGTLDVPRLVFSRGTSRVSDLSYKTLDQLADNLVTWPQYYLVVRGNTSAQGNVEANRKLAEARATAAVDYLVKKGVHRDRMNAETSKPNGSTTVAFILGELPY